MIRAEKLTQQLLIFAAELLIMTWNTVVAFYHSSQACSQTEVGMVSLNMTEQTRGAGMSKNYGCLYSLPLPYFILFPGGGSHYFDNRYHDNRYSDSKLRAEK